MAYIDNFDEDTIIDVASQYGSFMNAKGNGRPYLPPLMDRGIIDPEEEGSPGPTVPSTPSFGIDPTIFDPNNPDGQHRSNFINTTGPSPVPATPSPTSTGVSAVQTSSQIPQPSPFQQRMNNFGCNGLNSRRAVLQSKLNNLQSAGTNPQWVIQLQKKLNYIDNQLSIKNCSSPFSGANGLWMNGDI